MKRKQTWADKATTKGKLPLWQGTVELLTLAEKLSGGDVAMAIAMLRHAAQALEGKDHA